jgi:hypothetical protein
VYGFFGEAEKTIHPTAQLWHAAAGGFSPVQGVVEQVNTVEDVPPY